MADQWTLVYRDTSYTMGVDATNDAMFSAMPSWGGVSVTTEDAPRPRSDGDAFGVDFLGGQTVTFSLRLIADTEALVMAKYAKLALAWRADYVRSAPGRLAALQVTSSQGRGVRVAYGRPRRIAPNDSARHQGIIDVLCDFQTQDPSWYGDETTTLIPYRSTAPTGRFAAPFTTPLLAAATGSSNPNSIVVAGDVVAWPVVQINGPIVNPTVTDNTGWSLSLNGSVPAGQSVTLNTRPWVRTVMRSDGASMAGQLARATRLSKGALSPGKHEVVLQGTDPTFTSSVRLLWRPTYSSL